jgi:FkbM family methyltransferase
MRRILEIGEHSIFAPALRSGGYVLDIGANRGRFSKEIAAKFGVKPVCVEANPALARQLKEQGFHVLECAIGARDGCTQFYIGTNDEASSIRRPDGEGVQLVVKSTRQIAMKSLASISEMLDITDFACIKLDIEGAEVDVINSSSSLICKATPQWTIEFHDGREFQMCTREEVTAAIGRLKKLGFGILVRNWPARTNVLCLDRRTLRIGLADWFFEIALSVSCCSVETTEKTDKSLENSLSVKRVARALRIGPALLRLRRAQRFGVAVEVNTFFARQRYLTKVRSFPPMDAGAGDLDCFMLLNQARFWEGVWSLYSFRFNFGPCRVIVLNDGTLAQKSVGILHHFFAGIQIPEITSHDAMVAAYLREGDWRRCLEWRKSFVFFRKLIDPIFLARSDKILLLDSDCLHFQSPEEIKEWTRRGDNVRYIADSARHPFCTSAAELRRICGTAPPEFFCAGYLCIPRDTVDLCRVEDYLGEECFDRQLSGRQFAHVAEQTLYAMEAGRRGASVLPTSYATCPDLRADRPIMGHFCGGSYQRTWFYTQGLPLVYTHVMSGSDHRIQ